MNALRNLGVGPIAIVLGLAFVGCSSDDGTGEDDESLTGAYSNGVAYDFLDKPANEYKLVDTVGVALTGVALTNRSNAFNDVSPAGVSFLTTYREKLAQVHKGWRQQLVGLGFKTCSQVLPLTGTPIVTPCTLQKVSPDGPRVLDIVVPDSVTIDVSKPAGFPNGRVMHEQINDLVFAMGFLDIGGKCPADPSGYCTLHTFANLKMNKQENDKALPKGFPWLASPHGYDSKDHDSGKNYWPRPR